MLYETLQPQVTPESLCAVPVLACCPQSPSLGSTFHECHEHATPEEHRPSGHCQQEWLESGLCSQCLLPQPSRLCTLNTGSRTFGSCLLRLLPLFRFSYSLLCTKRLGRVAPLLGQVPSCQGGVSVNTAQWHQGPGGHPRLWDQWLVLWPRGDTYCHNTR